MTTLSRRAFMKILAASGASLAAACGTPPQSPSPPTSASTPTPDAAATAGGLETTPTSAAGAHPLPQPAPADIVITPNDKFYRQSYSSRPSVVDISNWRLTIDGLVKQPLTLTYDDLKALPPVEAMRTLECIGNPVGGPLIGNAVWKGFYLETLLREAEILPSAIRARFEAADGYYTSVKLEWIQQPGVFMIYEMNGEPLPPDHGYPLRILMPGLYGQKNPKWLRHIEFIDYEHEGYWESNGWSDVASVKTNSIIEQPRALEMFDAGVIPIFGVAFAGRRAIVSVEVSIDKGDWLEAELLHGPTNLAWTQWAFHWDAEPGKHFVRVRATDDAGFTQSKEGTSILQDSFPAGTDKIHSVIVKITA